MWCHQCGVRPPDASTHQGICIPCDNEPEVAPISPPPEPERPTLPGEGLTPV